MDLFKYKASVKQLEQCKYIKDLEALVRKYVNLVPYYAYQFKPDNIFYYKLLALSLKLFKNKSKKELPDFIYEKHTNAQKCILTSLFEADITENKKSYYASKHFKVLPNYEEFMDWFEFDSHISIPKSSWYVEKLNTIIGSNQIHFTVTFNYALDAFDRASTTLTQEQQMLVYSIRHKQVNFPNKPQTIWDLFIKDNIQWCKGIPLDTQSVNDDITKLKQHIKALEALG